MNDTSLVTSAAERNPWGYQDTDFSTGAICTRSSHKQTPVADLIGEETVSSDAMASRPLESRDELRRDHGKVAVDARLLGRAIEIVDGIDAEDVLRCAVDLEALRGLVLELWPSTSMSGPFAQEILATLESALLSVEAPTSEQVSAFREALQDLRSSVITEAHVNVIRRLFVSVGFSPLSSLSEIKADDKDEDEEV